MSDSEAEKLEEPEKENCYFCISKDAQFFALLITFVFFKYIFDSTILPSSFNLDNLFKKIESVSYFAHTKQQQNTTVLLSPTKIDQQKEQQEDITLFLSTMNPELNRKILKIQQEILNTEKNLRKLQRLYWLYPKQFEIINHTKNKWNKLLIQLKDTLKNINFKVEAAFVAYEIDQLQGTKKFKVISNELLENANTALLNADITKKTLEKQIHD